MWQIAVIFFAACGVVRGAIVIVTIDRGQSYSLFAVKKSLNFQRIVLLL